MRTLALTIFTFDVRLGAATWSVLVLYANQRLGMDAVGFGNRYNRVALGGVIGTVSYGRLERRFELSDIMRVGLIIETCTHLILALTTSAAIAWRPWSSSAEARVRVGHDLDGRPPTGRAGRPAGRVSGVYRVAIMGGIVIGTPIGGLLAKTFGITAPFWFAFAGSATFPCWSSPSRASFTRARSDPGRFGGARPARAARSSCRQRSRCQRNCSWPYGRVERLPDPDGPVGFGASPRSIPGYGPRRPFRPIFDHSAAHRNVAGARSTRLRPGSEAAEPEVAGYR